MDQKQIEAWAREAGLTTTTGWRDDGSTCQYWEAWPEQLTRFAALVAQSEREQMKPCMDALRIIAAQSSGKVCSTALADCMAATAAAAIRNTGG